MKNGTPDLKLGCETKLYHEKIDQKIDWHISTQNIYQQKPAQNCPKAEEIAQKLH